MGRRTVRARTSWAFLAVLFSGLLLSPCPARAGEDRPAIRLRIVYERAGDALLCPAEPAVLEVFRKQLAAGAVDPDAPASARVTVRIQSGRIVDGHVELIDGEGHQIWTNDLQARFNDCGTLIASLALSLRVALDAFNRPPPGATRPEKAEDQAARRSDEPLLVLAGPDPSPANTALPPLDPSHAAYRAAYHPAAPASESEDIGAPARFQSWASVALVTGIAPAPAPRVSLNMGLHWPSVSFSFEARGVPPVEASIDAYKVVIARWEGVFLPCAAWGIIFGCVTVAAGALWTEARLVDSEVRTRLHVALGMRLGFDLAITSHTAALAYFDIEAALLPATVVLDRILWDQPVTQAAMGIAFGGTFPGGPR